MSVTVGWSRQSHEVTYKQKPLLLVQSFGPFLVHGPVDVELAFGSELRHAAASALGWRCIVAEETPLMIAISFGEQLVPERVKRQILRRDVEGTGCQLCRRASGELRPEIRKNAVDLDRGKIGGSASRVKDQVAGP